MFIENLDEVKKGCLESYPQEACFIVKNGIAIQKENVHASPVESFKMEDSVSLDLDNIEAIIHSHTSNVNTGIDPRCPSMKDMQLAEATNKPQGILHCIETECSDILWFNDDSEIPDYLGRPYIPCVYDCLTLVRDYYIKEYDYRLGLLPRPTNWIDWNKDYMKDNLDNQGLSNVGLGSLEIGDILVFSILGIVCHLGVVTGENEFIHHLDKRGSCKDRISKWDRQIMTAYRL